MIAGFPKRVTDINTELTISLFSAYGAFVPASQLGVSGVLAAVTCGRLPRLARTRDLDAGEPDAGLRDVVGPHVPAQRRAFILIGLQLPVIVDGARRPAGGRGDRLRGRRLRDGDRGPLPVDFIVTFLVRTLDRRESQRARRASWRFRVVGSWAGMRGAVSLAAALALPLTTDAGIRSRAAS